MYATLALAQAALTEWLTHPNHFAFDGEAFACPSGKFSYHTWIIPSYNKPSVYHTN